MFGICLLLQTQFLGCIFHRNLTVTDSICLPLVFILIGHTRVGQLCPGLKSIYLSVSAMVWGSSKLISYLGIGTMGIPLTVLIGRKGIFSFEINIFENILHSFPFHPLPFSHSQKDFPFMLKLKFQNLNGKLVFSQDVYIRIPDWKITVLEQGLCISLPTFCGSP